MSSWFGASSNDTISWESEPKVRGTWTIISTCIVTIGLCVSKAIHLNIPDYKGAAQQKWLQLSWMLLGLLAPEMVAWTAWRQKRDAAALGQRLRSLLGESEKNSVTQDYPWTKTHSFYAIMGGFAFDTTSTGKHIMPGHHTRLTLTPRALQFLAKHDPHLIPNHTVEQIEDKSKADPMIKFVTCVQALWFCIQCIHRVAAGLAISLLELNTFAHSVCALLIYLLWWHKPLNIKEPTLVQGERMLEICAVMCLASELDGEAAEFDLFQYLPRFRDSDEAVLEKSVGIYRQTAEEQEGAKRIRFSPGQDSPDASDVDVVNLSSHAEPLLGRSSSTDTTNSIEKEKEMTPARRRMNIKAILRPRKATTKRNDQELLELRHLGTKPRTQLGGCWLFMGQTLHGFCYERISRAADPPPGKAGILSLPRAHIKLSSSSVLRWKYAASALRRYDLLETGRDGQTYIKGQYIANGVYQDHEDALHGTVCERIPNWPSDVTLTRIRDSKYTYLAFMGFTLAGALYGGLHLIAWDAPFSSASEKYLWRASGIILVSSGPGCALLLAIRTWYLRGIIEWRDEPLRNHDSFLVRTIVLGFQSWVGGGYYVTSGLLVTFFLLYMAARAYLVVECFINVANLPASVFEIPSWTQYVPHIT